MGTEETRREARARVVRELGGLLRRQARGRWRDVTTARKAAQGHQVWRFRREGDAGERFLHVSHEAIDQARSSSRVLFEQLRSGGWLDRLDAGGETAVRLTAAGQVEPYGGSS